MEQKEIFLSGEGDGYWARNSNHIYKLHDDAINDLSKDPILKAIMDEKPKRILEIGCANGWRLDVANKTWGATCTGIDPSSEAIEDGKLRYPRISLAIGTAENPPQAQFDCIIFGFCLYLCDRSDLYRIAFEADAVLDNHGMIVIYDFFPSSDHRNAYAHHLSVFANKMDYSRMWSWHPDYTMWKHEVFAHPGKSPIDPNERLAVTILKKHC